jgi:hypothetical protein
MRISSLLLVLGLLPAPAMASDLLPSCDAPEVLGHIVDRQVAVERDTWRDGHTFAAIVKPAEYRSATSHSAVFAERHCAAKAALASGHNETIYYVITAERGFAGLSWYVDYCVPGRDHFHVYDADCRVLR